MIGKYITTIRYISISTF